MPNLPQPPAGPEGDGVRPAARTLTWVERVIDALLWLVVTGPDPPAPDDPPSPMGFVLPWWARVVTVGAALAVGLTWSGTGAGMQLAWGLDYGALICVSLAASYWAVSLVVNLSFALLWRFLPLRSPEDHPRLWRFHHFVTFVNRQIGHLEAIAVWLVVATIFKPRLDVQLPFLAAVALMGAPIINGLTRAIYGSERTSRAGGELNWQRRPILYTFTTLGLVLLTLQAPRQFLKLSPLLAAVFLGGVVPRLWRHLRRERQVQRADPDDLALRARYRKVQMGALRRADLPLSSALVLSMAALVAVSWQRRRDYDTQLASALAPPGSERADVCTRDPGGPTAAEVSIFIASDTQLHELDGDRFPGQAELADALVPVALRPVELDALAAATLWRFGSVFGRLAADRTPAEQPLLWAHLGDFADLSCQGEMRRMSALFAHFADAGRLAGVAPGNHDKSFTGNFFWSPFWDGACNQQRMEKVDSDRLIEKMVSPGGRSLLVEGARMQPVESGLGLLSKLTGRGTALVTVSPLGLVTHGANRRALIGVFLDTADEIDFDLGVAGIFGTFSQKQADTAVRLVHELIVAKKVAGAEHDPYGDPLYVLFAHHPFDELAPDAHGRYAALISRLDSAPDPAQAPLPRGERDAEEARELPARVLALVAAHTHHAQAAQHCVRHRRFVREVVVGSTIDPPQEAALLTVGPDGGGVPSLRLRTIPAVAREDHTCGSEPTVPALHCQVLVARLQKDPACRALFRDDERRLAPDCQVLERPLSLTDRLRAIETSVGPTTPEDIRTEQVARSRHLFSCLHRGDPSALPKGVTDLVDDAVQTQFLLDFMKVKVEVKPTATKEEKAKAEAEAKAAATRREHELTCLAWAASAVQAHKAAGMEMADGLRCGFDDPTLSAAKEYVAVLDTEACR